MDKDYIKAQIQELTNQEEIHFANWQRTQGAKFAYQQVLAEMEREEMEMISIPDVKRKGAK